MPQLFLSALRGKKPRVTNHISSSIVAVATKFTPDQILFRVKNSPLCQITVRLEVTERYCEDGILKSLEQGCRKRRLCWLKQIVLSKCLCKEICVGGFI